MRLLITCIAVCLLAGHAHAGPYRPIKAKHFCMADSTGSKLEIQFISEPKYKTMDGEKVLRSVWSISCRGSDCYGAQISLDNIDRGKPLGAFDISRMIGITMTRDAVGRVLLSWGIRTFLMDPVSKTITYQEKGDSLITGKSVNVTFKAMCPDTW